MDIEEVEELTELVNQLNLDIKKIQEQLTVVKTKLETKRKAASLTKSKEENHQGHTQHDGLKIGDIVKIKNTVRLKGDIRKRANILADVVRFTNSFVVVKARKNGQEIRRFSTNLEKINDELH